MQSVGVEWHSLSREMQFVPPSPAKEGVTRICYSIWPESPRAHPLELHSLSYPKHRIHDSIKLGSSTENVRVTDTSLQVSRDPRLAPPSPRATLNFEPEGYALTKFPVMNVLRDIEGVPMKTAM